MGLGVNGWFSVNVGMREGAYYITMVIQIVHKGKTKEDKGLPNLWMEMVSGESFPEVAILRHCGVCGWRRNTKNVGNKAWKS